MTEKQMFDFLVENGLSENGAAAVLGNFKEESALKANNLQNSGNTKLKVTDEEYTAAVDNGSYKNFETDSIGYGLAQWTYSTRKKGLLSFARQQKTSIGDPKMQLLYFLKECKGYGSVWKKLTSNNDIEDSTVEMMLKYEKPANQSEAAQKSRISFAKAIFDRCSKKVENTDNSNFLKEDTIRESIIEAGIKYLGKNSIDNSHKVIVDAYNRYRPLPRNYIVKYTDPWCATFASVCAIDAKLTSIIPVECSCGNLITLFKEKGCWVEDDSYIPKTGDYIFYDWDDNGVGDNIGWPDHVGIVVGTMGDTIKVLEGNMEKTVGYRNIPVNAKGIRGFGVPKYEFFAVKDNLIERPAQISKTPKWLGEVFGCSKLNIRKWAGKDNAPLTSRGPLIASDLVEVCDTLKDSDGKDWYYVRVDGKTFGFVSSEYVRRSQ